MNSNVWKMIAAGLLSALITFLVMWFTMAPNLITRADAEVLIQKQAAVTLPETTAFRELSLKQDTMQKSIDDLRERLARIEQAVTDSRRSLQ